MPQEHGLDAQVLLADILTILHLSDAHFGMGDQHAEMPRITDGIIRAARDQDWSPDLIVFSGDLAFSGLEREFDIGIGWLERVARIWSEAQLFVVPGNHDVNRSKAKLWLRKSYTDEDAFSGRRNSLQADCDHLGAFFAAHARMRLIFKDRIASEWSDCFGCSGELRTKKRLVRLIGLNTALLSCDGEDEGKLIQDLATLNNHLNARSDDSDCVVVIGHHPLSWLAKWNQEHVERLLSQEAGANIYMHGHNHVQSASAFGNASGQNLTILQGGATYQGSQWAQDFSFHRLNFSTREVDTRAFSYHTTSGRWLQNNERSRRFVAALPQGLPSVQTASQASSVVSSIIPRFMSQEHEVELEARRFLDKAQHVHKRVLDYLKSARFPDRPIYGMSERIKDLNSIKRKVLSRRTKGADAFSVSDVEDISAFRYVVLYQSDIPYIVEKLLSCVSLPGSPFVGTVPVKATIHTSRPTTDPLSIVSDVQRVLSAWSGKSILEPPRSQPTGYSSIHLVIGCSVHVDGQQTTMPVEFQVRSGLEEFWSQLDHKLRYETSRGSLGDNAWQRHLNVLKAQFDSVIQYVDLIREMSQSAPSVKQDSIETLVAPSQQSLSSRERQLSLLVDLPKPIYLEVSFAFDLWQSANESRQFGGNPSEFRRAADAFIPFLDGRSDDVADKILSERLRYIAHMERAYMLQFTQDNDDLAEAVRIYMSRIAGHPRDVSALFRLGQVLSEQGHHDEAMERYNSTITAIEDGTAEDLDDAKSRVYDFVRLGLSLAHFRQFENNKMQAKEREVHLKNALELCKVVYQKGSTWEGRRQALNDFAYYAWEERTFAKHYSAELSVSDEDFRKMAFDLAHDLEGDKDASFRKLDTLARVQHEIGAAGSGRAAARGVCLQLETAAQRRSGGLPDLEGERFGGRWAARVTKFLINEDERDALFFALGLVEGPMDYEG